ncbi:MAG: transcription factor S [Candidatus Nanoarchaeia archaeon]
MVDFCEKCGALIMGTAGEDITCSSCGHENRATSSINLSQEVEKKRELEVLGDEAEAEVNPLTSAECERCGHDKAYFWTKQMRAGDEPETQFYKCEKCGHQWRDYM